MLTIQILRECLELCEQEGLLRWKTRPLDHFRNERACLSFNARYAGTEAGTIYKSTTSFRKRIVIFDKSYLYHRIVYAMHHGIDLNEVPKILDHKDGDSLNNQPSNLRSATSSQNACNRLGWRGSHKGVIYVKKDRLYLACITFEGRSHRLGYFKTEGEAIAAYRTAAPKIHGEFARF